ncbi:HlyC/CorC family transporter [Thioflexithrix psekupsensis]|uniref:Magnesium and cobalt efflux protein CorC n=1 Tax=Thioflexithrix psekupsensis TaxID=1570016 RepID=A0A251X632_9GAMM|nr:HlyC/CorC family transporter [Thioflexithrix psekupsensis]OUD13205.1 magnesium/cobalt efflux protein [Thioflexithrix psekupsensis]
MSSLYLSLLLGALVFLILSSAFFSSSETSMMAINRYRLKHLAAQKHKGALRVSRLLERPDRLIGVILLGNNFVNILASSIATVLAIQLLGEEVGIPIATLALTVIILIFGEVTPKTIAVLHPEKLAFPASFIITPLLKISYPLVWLVNSISNVLLRLFGIDVNPVNHQRLNSEELRSVVHEAEGIIPKRHQQMLLGILDLERATVEDIMVPRNEIVGIDLDDSEEEIAEQIANAQHTRLPIYRESIDNVVGIVHLRKLIRLFRHQSFSREALENMARDLYFVPEGTPLNTQLINFQHHKRRIGLVVNEYGEIQGLVTLEDILEEVVGEFTTNPDAISPEIHPQSDGTYLVDGSITIRELNRVMQWQLPTEGPKTLNGLILDYLEVIPETGTSLRLHGYPMEVVQMANNAIKTVRIHPIRRMPPPPK